MTPDELYKILDQAGADYEVVEFIEGVRHIRVVVEEPKENDDEIIECIHKETE